ncbi:meiotic recombination [Epicoccum nigrum]|nr:meiotic recombination [Epicoccum nigrum]
MAPAYKVEELLALRDSVSESAVSLDRFADEVVIKEHVLRPCASAQLISRRSEGSFRAFVPKTAATEVLREVTPEAAPIAGSQGAYKRPSPSPSVKRGKAERLLKEHGSPPGLRVTAGGRIVLGDLPPLGPRPSFNIYNPQALRITAGTTMVAPSQTSSDNAARIEIVGGQPVVVIGDRMFALPAVNNGTAIPAPTPTVNEAFIKQSSDIGPISAQGALPELPFNQPRSSSQVPFEGLDLPTLKTQQTVKKQELRTVEQTEVLQSGHQNEAWRANMIEKKRSLIVELDALRKQIVILESDPAAVDQTPATTPATDATTASAPLLSFMPPYQQPLPQSIYGYPSTNPYAPVMMYPAPMGPFANFAGANPPPFVPPVSNPAHSPGSNNRRSRAIEIKPPREEPKKQPSSTLDPKSPTYEPKISKDTAPPTPSPNKISPWRRQEISQSDNQTRRTLSHRPSLSSVDTTDFFPTNAHEHSSTRVAPSTNLSQPGQEEISFTLATPEKSWPASPWNEGRTGRSNNIEPVPKIGSWPEAFGKPQCSSPVKQEAGNQPPGPVQNRAPQAAGDLQTASSNTMLAQGRPQQHVRAEDLWPFKVPKQLARIPSTYQEGFQAGYDHAGLPDNVEVLQGYIQGLLTFLADSLNERRSSASRRGSQTQTVDSRVPSLHGALVNPTPHASTISLPIGRTEAIVSGQENVRTGYSSGVMGSRRDSAYNPSDSTRNIPAFLASDNDFTQKLRPSSDSGSKFHNPMDLSTGYRHATSYTSPEQEMGKASEKGTTPRPSSLAAKDSFGRQFSGNQLANRANASHQPQQRFYPIRKENGPNGFGGGKMSAGRPFANNRVSGLDGAMDDLADLVVETSVDSSRLHANRAAQAEITTSIDAEETGASCFKPSGGKGKQKMYHSPAKTARSAQDPTAASPANTSESPKKSGEHSPAKAKLEQVTHRFRRSKKDDPRSMSSEEKVTRSEKWKKRFDSLKQVEKAEIEKYREEEGRKSSGRR